MLFVSICLVVRRLGPSRGIFDPLSRRSAIQSSKSNVGVIFVEENVEGADEGQCALRRSAGEFDLHIVIENVDTEDVNSLFRVTVNGRPVADGFTAAQTHLLVGEIFERAFARNRRYASAGQILEKAIERQTALPEGVAKDYDGPAM
jgi:hypothetical protein